MVLLFALCFNKFFSRRVTFPNLFFVLIESWRENRRQITTAWSALLESRLVLLIGLVKIVFLSKHNSFQEKRKGPGWFDFTWIPQFFEYETVKWYSLENTNPTEN